MFMSVQTALCWPAYVHNSNLVNVEVHGHTVGALVNIDWANSLGPTASQAAPLWLGHHGNLLWVHARIRVPNSYEHLLSLREIPKVVFIVEISMQGHDDWSWINQLDRSGLCHNLLKIHLILLVLQIIFAVPCPLFHGPSCRQSAWRKWRGSWVHLWQWSNWFHFLNHFYSWCVLSSNEDHSE